MDYRRFLASKIFPQIVMTLMNTWHAFELSVLFVSLE